jgi:hypothetical protein
VVFGSNHGECVGLIAPFLKIETSDLAENAGEPAVDIGLLAHIRCLEQIATDFRGRGRCHLFDAHNKHDACSAGLDCLYALMHGGGPGRAGVLDARRSLEAQIRRGLQYK